jgi:putative ABC transport system permease protein
MVNILSFGEGYRRSLRTELDRMGLQMMVVPLGCPFDAAARVLKGRALDVSLPMEALEEVRGYAGTAVAAPVCTASVPRLREGRTDLWVGIDTSVTQLKPWWKLEHGSRWFGGADEVILGAEAAAAERRRPGDRFYSPEAKRSFTVSGVLQRSGTSDDSLFFVPLSTAQEMFGMRGRLTAVYVRLKDPSGLMEATDRFQQIRGAQVVTLTEMMGTFLNLMGSARSIALAIALISVAVGGLTVFNTMLASVLERTRELGVMRAVGMSRSSAFALMSLEAVLISAAGGAAGLAVAAALGPLMQLAVRPLVPLAPSGLLPSVSPVAAAECLAAVVVVGVCAGLYPAFQASRLCPAEALRSE